MVQLFLHYSKKRNDSSEPALATSAPSERASDLTPLLQRCRAGEDSAWSKLHQQFAPFIHGIILASGQSPDDADELVQEVFLRVFRKIDGLTEAGAFPAWLRRLTKNLVVDRIRRRSCRPPTTGLAPEQLQPVNDANDHLARQVLKRIRTLPDAYQEPLILRLVEGLSGREIAQLTGLTPDSVRVNLYRGMAQLRVLLKKDGLP